MAINLSEVSLVLDLTKDIIADVQKGIAVGGGVVPESVAVAEALFMDADFKAKIVALVDALKA